MSTTKKVLAVAAVGGTTPAVTAKTGATQKFQHTVRVVESVEALTRLSPRLAAGTSCKCFE